MQLCLLFRKLVKNNRLRPSQEHHTCLAIMILLAPYDYLLHPDWRAGSFEEGFSEMIRGGHSKLGSQVLVCFSMYYHHFLPCILWLTGSTKTRNGTERNGTNGTNGTVVFRRRDEGTTDFCLYVALHRRYSNVHVAAKVSTYSKGGMHCRTRLLPVAYSRNVSTLRGSMQKHCHNSRT